MATTGGTSSPFRTLLPAMSLLAGKNYLVMCGVVCSMYISFFCIEYFRYDALFPNCLSADNAVIYDCFSILTATAAVAKSSCCMSLIKDTRMESLQKSIKVKSQLVKNMDQALTGWHNAISLPPNVAPSNPPFKVPFI
eukprot:TRINITY_DN869_c0_g1_i2.p1 TRINITY_DN869_c0_g1~~TRINITY_DN869_c0_g1_i2.p1  ORF type:complete len:138 (-),score=12.18 TRINITY_DN869_c0_g1_i2:169-582(-)